MEEVKAHVEFLSNIIGERIAGTDSIYRASKYVYESLRRYGVDARGIVH